jgi:hypothetical protein
MADVVIVIFKEFEITAGKRSYFVLDNTYNNNTTIATIALKIGFNATERRLRCGPYTLNLIGQMLLWGEEKESYGNDESERVNEAENMATWRTDGPLGVLLAVINYIKTPHNTRFLRSFNALPIMICPPTCQRSSAKYLNPLS